MEVLEEVLKGCDFGLVLEVFDDWFQQRVDWAS